MDQGSAPTLKWIFGQGFPKLHPFGLSPLILISVVSTVTVYTDPRSSDSGHILMSYAPLDQGSVLVVQDVG